MVIVTIQYLVSAEEVAVVRPAHVEFLTGLHQQGILINGGPNLNGNGGVLVINAEDQAAAEAILRNDPYQKTGIVKCDYMAFAARF